MLSPQKHSQTKYVISDQVHIFPCIPTCSLAFPSIYLSSKRTLRKYTMPIILRQYYCFVAAMPHTTAGIGWYCAREMFSMFSLRIYLCVGPGVRFIRLRVAGFLPPVVPLMDNSLSGVSPHSTIFSFQVVLYEYIIMLTLMLLVGNLANTKYCIKT